MQFQTLKLVRDRKYIGQAADDICSLSVTFLVWRIEK